MLPLMHLTSLRISLQLVADSRVEIRNSPLIIHL